MGLYWGALAGSFLAPFLYSLYWKKTTKASCVACFIWGSVLMLANMFFKSSFPAVLQSPINCGAFAMLGGMVIVPIVSAFTSKPDKAAIDSIFSCYDKKVMAPIKDVLSSEEA